MVWEFTRGMVNDNGCERRAEAKLQAYHWVLVHQKHKFADYIV